MKISIILAHPNPVSFNHAIAQVAAEALRGNGHEVRLRDLCAERFDPLMSAAEFAEDAKLDATIAQHCQEIAAADGIIIAHPNWWGMPPAILKGWIDRVLRPELAYRFVAGKPEGLLKARVALVFTTANTPDAAERELYGDPLDGLWKKCVFGLCGVEDVQRRSFTSVIVSTLEQRAAWLSEVQATVMRSFPVTPN